MVKQSRWKGILVSGVLILILALGIGAAFAQTNSEENPETDGPRRLTFRMPGFHGHGRGMMSADNSEQLAEALGVTVEELQAAHTEARAAAIAQAVTDGRLTQEQADQMLDNEQGRQGRMCGPEQDNFLAEALGITVEELKAARQQVHEARLAEMVASGAITQEQADLMLAQKAVQGYMDSEAMQSAAQAIYATAVAQAVADDVITQEQADQLLSSPSFGPRGFGRGSGHHHSGPRGFMPTPNNIPALFGNNS